VTVGYCTSLLSCLLGTNIAIYRWVYVCHSDWLLTAFQRKIFFLVQSGVFLVLTTTLTTGAYMYREQYSFYHHCLNPNVTNPVAFYLRIYNPFRFFTIFSFLSYLLLACFSTPKLAGSAGSKGPILASVSSDPSKLGEGGTLPVPGSTSSSCCPRP
jgi:hypothetical protein